MLILSIKHPADMQLLSKYNKGVRFLLCVIDIYLKHARIVLMKDNSIAITSAFQKIIDEYWGIPNKSWVDQGSEFYKGSMRLLLPDSSIEIYSTNIEGKSVLLKDFS